MVNLFSDFIILYLISRYRLITLRQLSYYTGASLGTVHSKILNLNKKKLLLVNDISQGSRKKRLQYLLTEEGLRYMETLRLSMQELFSDSKESPTFDFSVFNKFSLFDNNR
jgi:DNA-binding PadR family transcriptional regulator